jgi:hypothetical protein
MFVVSLCVSVKFIATVELTFYGWMVSFAVPPHIGLLHVPYKNMESSMQQFYQLSGFDG